MKKINITYWTSTAIFSVLMVGMGIMFFVNPQIAQNFEHLGFPDYFRIELGIAKIAGAIMLIVPFRGRLNEWIYAGFTIDMLSASIAHIASGDPVMKTLIPLVFLSILLTSYFTGHKFNKLL